jgi:hypothetical protein
MLSFHESLIRGWCTPTRCWKKRVVRSRKRRPTGWRCQMMTWLSHQTWWNMVSSCVFLILWHELWWNLPFSYLFLAPSHCKMQAIPWLVDPGSPLELSGLKWAPTCEILYPIRRLQQRRPVNLKTRRPRDGTPVQPVHKSKFRKAVRLHCKGIGVTWAVFKPLLVDDDRGRCHPMHGGDCGIHQAVQSGILTFASASNI